MFRNINHTHYLHKYLQYNGQVGFVSYVFINCQNRLPKADLTIYTNKLLLCCHVPYNIEEESINQYCGKILIPWQILCYPHINKPKIIFPTNSYFAKYEYTFQEITLEKKNTFVFSGAGKFDIIDLQFTPSNKKYCVPWNKYSRSLFEQLIAK
jgi:hypothetical protein